jgi:hypothetical protein
MVQEMTFMTEEESVNLIELYDKLIATNPYIKRKGKTTPYTSLNGHMFSFITKEGDLALRLPVEDRDDFIKKYNTTLCTQYGKIMKEYVIVPENLLKKTNELKYYFTMSHSYVGGLRPKPTKKKS